MPIRPRTVGNPIRLCGAAAGAGPVTIIGREQLARDDARAELASLRAVLRARVACVPDDKDYAGTPGVGLFVGAGCDRCHGPPCGAEAVAG